MRAGLGPEEKGGLAFFSDKAIKDKEEERERGSLDD